MLSLHLGGDSNVRRGKLMYLSGNAIPPLPDKTKGEMHSQELCDLRSGWLCAEAMKTHHPDWTDEFILA